MSGPGHAAWKTAVPVLSEDDGLNAEDTRYSVHVHFFPLPRLCGSSQRETRVLCQRDVFASEDEVTSIHCETMSKTHNSFSSERNK